jgi:outer membrane lipoprotein-sorting protein
VKSADDIRKFFQSAGLRTHPDVHERIFEDVLRAHERGMANPPAQPGIGRQIMKNPAIKYGIAAVLGLAAAVGFSLFHGTGGITWAIEQSIEALGKYRAIVVEGSAAECMFREGGGMEPRSFKAWAVANEDQTAVRKARHEVNGIPILTTNGEKTWWYYPGTNTVRVENRAYVASEFWAGSRFLEQLKAFHDSGVLTRYETTSGEDPGTGKPRIVLRCAWEDKRYNGPRSMRVEVDAETKLLIGFQQWENSSWEGPATIVGEKITYCESLPDELFEFQIPPGATVQEQ